MLGHMIVGGLREGPDLKLPAFPLVNHHTDYRMRWVNRDKLDSNNGMRLVRFLELANLISVLCPHDI